LRNGEKGEGDYSKWRGGGKFGNGGAGTKGSEFKPPQFSEILKSKLKKQNKRRSGVTLHNTYSV
jgi:hypothetical protein